MPCSRLLTLFVTAIVLVTQQLPADTVRSNEDEEPSDSTGQTAEEWPRWRGPRGNGTWYGPEIAEPWPDEGLKRRWRTPVGGGYAGVIVADDRVFVCDRQTDPQEVERVLCFDADRGRELWTHAWPVEYGNLDYGNGPRAAVTVFDGRVYALGTMGSLRCLDAETGRLLWECHLVKDHGGRVPMWGYAASPLVFESLLIVLPGAEDEGSILALDRKTGRKVWAGLPDEAGYATPMLIDHAGTRQLICWTPSHIRSLDPRTGKLFWSVPYEVTYGVAIAAPIYHRGIVFVSGYWEGSRAVQLGRRPADAELLWEENRFLRGVMSQPLYRDGYVYLLDKAYGLTCFELETGRKLWDDGNRMTPRGRNPQASLVRLGESDRMLALNSDGDLVLARFDPDGYHELARANIIGETWAHPACAGNRVYARSDDELVCVELPTTGQNPR